MRRTSRAISRRADPAIVVFVYGTLLSGEASHALLQDARFLGEARTTAAFELLDCGDFPGMIAGGATVVAGELYQVDPPTLAALDRFEGHPNLFGRTRIVLAGGRSAYTYLLRRRRRSARLIPTGAWRSRAS